MSTRQYIGARYVPKFASPIEWSNVTPYEALTIVTYLGNSYTSKKPVPANIDISNGEYWVLTGNYNAQLQEYINKVDMCVKYKDTVADMIDDSSLVSGDIVETLGYYATNDGGRCYYIISSTQPATEYVTLDSGLYGVMVIPECVTPEMFGAYGNGVADDTSAIQKAINTNKKVLLYGSYKITSKLELISNTYVEGGGSLVFGDINDTTLIYGNALSNITFKDIYFNFGTQTNLKHGITILSSSTIVFDNCKFTGGYGYCFRLNYSTGTLITHCTFADITGADTNPGGCIYGIDTKNTVIENNMCNRIYDHFVYLTGPNTTGARIISNNINTTGTNTNTNGAGIVMYNGVHECIIANNRFSQCKNGIQLSSEYGEDANTVSRILIVNNEILSSTVNAITLQGTSAKKVNECEITSNYIRQAGQDVISLRYAINTVISNNYMHFGTRFAIETSNTDRTYIKNNTIYHRDSTNPITLGYQGASNDDYVCDNIFYFTNETYACIYPREVSGTPVMYNNFCNGAKVQTVEYTYPLIYFTLSEGITLTTANNIVQNCGKINNLNLTFGGLSTTDRTLVATMNRSIVSNKTITVPTHNKTTGAINGIAEIIGDEIYIKPNTANESYQVICDVVLN